LVRLGALDTNNWGGLLRRLRKHLGDQADGEAATTPASGAASGSVAGDDEVINDDGAGCQLPAREVGRIRHPELRPLSPATREAIQALAGSGQAASEVAARFGVHPGTVRRLWRQRPTPPRRGPHRFTAEHRAQALELLAQGVSLIDIGVELGFDRGTVRKHVAAG